MSPIGLLKTRRLGPLVLAQSSQDAERFRALGAPRVAVTGNLKWDAAPLAVDEAELVRLQASLDGRTVWLAASTHAGEEAIVAAAHQRLAALSLHFSICNMTRMFGSVSRTAAMPALSRAASLGQFASG